jgi:FtsP/CotA-like multicopper oxidase with cupredoxin domain
MTRNQRIGLIVAALVVAVVGFLIASPGSDEDGGQAGQTTMTQTETGGGDETAPTETVTETETEPPPPTEPEVTRIRIRGGEVVGGPPDITVTSGDVVRIVVSSDAPDDIHLHGYDIERQAAPGRPARFRVRANLEGSFEVESHVAEDAGRDPLVARLNVEPR